MLFHAHAPACFWFDAFATATHIINHLPSSLLHNKSPFETLYGSIPYYPNFKPFGCRVFPYLRDYSPHKIAPRNAPCIFLGYSSIHKGFRCYDPTTSLIYITRHAQFDELLFPFSQSGSSISRLALDISSFFEVSHASHAPPQQPSAPLSSPSSIASSKCISCPHDTFSTPPLESPSADSIPQSPPHDSNSTSAAPFPPPAAAQSTHYMITRAKAGIF